MITLNTKLLDEKIDNQSNELDHEILRKIRNFILNANEFELANINTNKFADKERIDKIIVLKTFLHLTKNGIFNLLWTVHCPSCKGANQLSPNLTSIKHDSSCEMCKMSYDAGFDKNVQLSFEISQNIADLGSLDPYEIMMSGLDTEPGIIISIDNNGSHFIQTDVTEGNYLLFNINEKKGINFAVLNDDNPQTTDYKLDYSSDFPKIKVERLESGKFNLTINNNSGKNLELLFTKQKKSEWSDASFITSLQEFRDMFSNEVLSINEAFSIQNLSFIFTDIKSSTEMYEKLGDSKAFFLIKEHFKILEKVVKRNNGGIVKTIGDAIMAVFTVSENALKASYEMIEEFDTFNRENDTLNQIFIKVGIHSGACIAVNLNDKIDYFGTCVNTAARVQGLSDGREIMVSDKFFNDSSAKDFFIDKDWTTESFVTSLKGLKDNHKIHKLIKK